MSDAEFTLKSTPPRLPRAALARERLVRFRDEALDRTAICVVAPAGFGKTTLLLQWRRRWLEHGAVVAWLDADAQDTPARFAMALLHALRAASGRAGFDALAARFAREPQGPVDALTALLAGIAGLGVDTVLMLDEAENLPDDTVRTSLRYLLLNAPANLCVVVGSRVPLSLPATGLATQGNFAALGVDDLRLRLDETVEILERRLGARVGLDDRARVQEATGGWPLGLQLALSAIERERELPVALARMATKRGHLQEYFDEALDTHQPQSDVAFLVRVSIADPMTPELCHAVTGVDDARGLLERLLHDTPILMVDEERHWFRLHPLAREFLLARFAALPRAERDALHVRACHWCAGHEHFHEAAQHALAAGDDALAHGLAARSLWTLGTQGKLAEAQPWLERIPEAMVAQDPALRLMVSWFHALGDRNAEAMQTAFAIADEPATPLRVQRLALRVGGGAAMFSDRAGRIPGLIARWPAADAGDDPLFQVVPLNADAYVAFHAGDTPTVRDRVASVLRIGHTGTVRLAAAFAQVMAGVCQLRDGDVVDAERGMRRALERAEREEGRRHTVPCLFAAVLAAALLERGDTAAAQALLADRLDIIEAGPPDIVLLAYRTLATLALAQGDERRALLMLAGLDTLAQRRRLPRLHAIALAEQVRVHALNARHDTVDRLLRELDAAVEAMRDPDYAPLLPQVEFAAAVARAHAALACDDIDAADAHLAHAAAFPRAGQRPRDAWMVQVLRAVLSHRRGRDDALPRLAEVLGLARLGGSERLAQDTHPLAARLAAGLPGRDGGAVVAHSVADDAAKPAPTPPRSGLLTSKEAEILQLLDKGLSNKAIARALDVSSETVKWHVKNLFAKLSAGTRRHAVDRAKLLGLVVG